ncbi:GntR family transcriptional regulator [Telmatospirillum sp. J64-1]|uniref:GntR family transcriptional regulator n=1 Tax=Telmatospirillum sp. J64-1 TaxID=2502183 RepID=UPI00115DD75C|nr:GntR family transcriptional regulator [Telmatospirillum sp. J64-1]
MELEAKKAESAPAGRRQRVKPVARPAQRGTSIAAVIYRDLRHEIVSLSRKPGEAISEKQIAETYGVSRTPVREAMLKLADESLIEIFPQSGTFVSRIPLAALPESITIRRVLEEASVKYAAERASRSQIVQLQAIIERQREAEATEDYEAFHQADEAFHAALAEAAGLPGLWGVAQQVKVQVDRYRRLTLPVLGRIKVVIAEHEAILEAVASHDPERAVQALNVHLDDLQGTIEEARDKHPLYFSIPEEN